MASDSFPSATRGRYDVRMAMRDGVALAADLYLPVGAPERLGTVLVRTPYDRREWRSDDGAENAEEIRLFVQQGFAVLVQDVRGKWGSEGAFRFYRHEREDGWDTLDWIVAQPWSNGRVATYGCSYLGEVQLLLAATGHPAHVAMVPQTGACVAASFGVRTGGAVDLLDSVAWFSGHGAIHLSRGEPAVDVAQAVWTLPVVDAIAAGGGPESDYEAVLRSVPDDAWWNEEVRQITAADRFDVPGLWIDSWFDRAADTLAMVERLRRESGSERARRNQFAVISTCKHCEMHKAARQTQLGEADVGDARYPFYPLYVAWMRHWLEDPDPGDFELPAYTYYAVATSEWRTTEQWPPAGVAPAELALSSDGSAAAPGGAGELTGEPAALDAVDAYGYDPADPCPALGGISYYPEMGWGGIADQRPLRERPDVAFYFGRALDEPLELAGAPELDVFVSSSAPDTDLVAKLLDVLPDGRCWNVSQAILRLRYRDGFAAPRLLEPGVVEQVRLALGPIAYRFAAGHRVGLMVTSSDFPAYDRNLNVEEPAPLAAEGVVARTTLHHGPSHPSRLVLPVLGREAQPSSARAMSA